MSDFNKTELTYDQKKNIERMPERAYVVWLSTGRNVQIDADELPIVEQACITGKIAKVRQGLINPSYIVTVMLDHQRLHKLLEVQMQRKRDNANADEYHMGEKKHIPTLTTLPDVTSRVEDAPQLRRIATFLPSTDEFEVKTSNVSGHGIDPS